jgi:diaminopimelate decarboxylase
MSTPLREAKPTVSSSCCGTCGCRAAVAVDAALSPRIESFLEDRQRLLSLCDTFGSPLNLIFPQQVLENIDVFKRVMSERLIQGEVLCTSKPNRSRAALSSLGHSGVPVDVSSLGALREALTAGLPGRRIQATGPKTIEYISLALAHEAILTVDNLAELSMLEQILAGAPLYARARILIRIRGRRTPRHTGHQILQTFGYTEGEVPESLTRIARQSERITLEGFHFHLHGATNEERRDTFEVAFDALRHAREAKLRPSIINVGGGYKIRYARSTEQWNRFNTYLKSAVRGEVKPITWQNDGLGFRFDSKGLSGAPQFIDHSPELTGADEFAALLSLRCPMLDDQPIERIVSDSMLQLWVEPGRASFDQAGVTIGRVSYTTVTEGERPIIRVEMNQSNLRSTQQRLLTQPLFVPRGPRTSSPQGVFLVGNLCVAEDLLQRNTVYPGFIPERGDLVVFANTAPYLMDFIEAPMLHQPVARKVAALERGGTWKTFLDEEFSATRFALER